MINFLFTTEQYEEEAQCHSLSKEAQRIREKLKTPGYELPDKYRSFPGNYYKVRCSNLRIILTRNNSIINNQEVCIYVALRVLKHDCNEYRRFHDKRTPESERDSISCKSSIDWDVYISKVKEDLEKPTTKTKKPGLTDAEMNFISTQLEINHKLFEDTIYETEKWIKDIQNPSFNDYDNACETIKDCVLSISDKDDGWHTMPFVNQKKYLVLYYQKGHDLILDSILEQNESLENKPTPIDFRRGYPDSFLNDPDEWRKMELDPKSNLVLSQKQVEIVSSDYPYPFFLTGRAGSGKSTMLQYLFAEVVLRYLYTTKLVANTIKLPLYISYSKGLVDDAKKLCRTLFEKNNIYRKELTSYDLDYSVDINPIMDDMFYEFEKLLRLCVSKLEDPEIVFPSDKKVSFPVFNAKWKKKFGRTRDAAKKYGPSISWHVIRTYIKGWYSDRYMTPEDYVNIGKDNQTVHPETFKLIYDLVWDWYSQEDAWDEQDIVKYCLVNNLVGEQFSAVFCDESQDFTRIEIDFILKLSSFSNRTLQDINEINKLPFVFAGDEFQTLNPTGFNWSMLSSYFTGCLRDSAGFGNSREELSVPAPIELSENFRSTSQIVKLANRIQLLRAARLKHYSEPQTSHFHKEGSLIYCVPPTKKLIDDLKRKEVRLIVPSADGENIKDYIENSGLKGLIQFDSSGTPDMTVLNPMQAKGIEYPNVAIYGFNNDGLLSPINLDNLISWFENPIKDDVADIELKYRVSNAYVAVTRASSNLYILDDFNPESFWSFSFSDEDIDHQVASLQNSMLQELKEGQRNKWSDEDLGWILNKPEGVDITDENLSYLSSPEHKRDEENKAMSDKDSSMMRQVARYHRTSGDKIDEARCLAKAFYIDEEYLQAAEWFVKANEYDDAIDNYWDELNRNPSDSIVSEIAELKDYSSSIKVTLCCMALTKPTVSDFKKGIELTLRDIRSDQKAAQTTDAWQYVLNLALQKIQSKKKEDRRYISIIVKKRQQLQAMDIELNISMLAELAFNAGAHNEAILLWESLEKSRRPKEYYLAKLETLKYPYSIEFYEGTGDPNWKSALMAEYRKNQNAKLNDNQRLVVASAVVVEGEKTEFLKFLPFMLRTTQTIDDGKKILDLSDKFECNLNKDVLSALIEARFSDLTNWSRPKKMFAVSEANLLLDAIEAVKTLHQDYSKVIDNKIKAGYKIEDIWKEFQKFSRNNSSWLVFFTLGSVIEKRGRYIDAIRFYEWANKQTDDKILKRAFDVRWIACKERQAENDDNDNYRNEAIEKRHRLSIPEDIEIPIDPKMSPTDWEGLFKYYSTISNEEIAEAREREKKIEEKEIVRKAIPKTDRLPLKKQELRYNDYSVVFFPGKGDVVIKDTVNEYQVRIKDGVFPDGGDFILKDSRVYVSDDDTPTPFVFERNENNLIIKVYELDEYTGMAISINLVS